VKAKRTQPAPAPLDTMPDLTIAPPAMQNYALPSGCKRKVNGLLSGPKRSSVWSMRSMGEELEMCVEKPFFNCPLSGKLMVDPVIMSDGWTYERAAIEEHIKKGLGSPMNGKQFTDMVIPNRSLKRAIDLFRESMTVSHQPV